MRHFPVVVVGSGPAGSACARAIKAAGVSCLVVEKHGLPRNKTCSGVVFGQCQELLQRYFGALPPPQVRCSPEYIHAENVVECRRDGSHIPYVWELPKDGHVFSSRWINVWRSKFDHWLLLESQAEVLEQTRCLGISPVGRRIQVDLEGADGAATTISCDYLVAADGSRSTIRDALDPEWIRKAKSCMATYSYYEYDDPGQIQDGHWYVFRDRAFGDIISCVHRKDDTLAVSVGGFPGTRLKGCEQRFTAYLQEHHGVSFRERRFNLGCSILLGPPDLGKDNVLLAGDAAGLVYLNGEGLSSAIDSGYRAGQAVVEAMAAGKTDAATLYNDKARDLLGHMEHCLRNLNFMVPG